MKYFKDTEHRCRCGCERVGITSQLAQKLDKLREIVGRPLTLNSAYRCPEHPIEKRKKTVGTHARGVAVDIRVKNLQEFIELATVAKKLGFNGIGLHPSFIHIDLRAKRTWWTY